MINGKAKPCSGPRKATTAFYAGKTWESQTAVCTENNNAVKA